MNQEANTSKFMTTGKRKEAVARIALFAGSGKITVNGRDYSDYFKRESERIIVRQPLQATKTINQFDVVANINGGGTSGQAGALRHGISKALVLSNSDLRVLLRKEGFLTRDPRSKERKKYGQKGARKRFQWTKR